jgi:hypothetical protein
VLIGYYIRWLTLQKMAALYESELRRPANASFGHVRTDEKRIHLTRIELPLPIAPSNLPPILTSWHAEKLMLNKEKSKQLLQQGSGEQQPAMELLTEGIFPATASPSSEQLAEHQFVPMEVSTDSTVSTPQPQDQQSEQSQSGSTSSTTTPPTSVKSIAVALVVLVGDFCGSLLDMFH